MIATRPSAPARQMPPHVPIVAGALAAVPGARLDVTDGLVSVGQQAWVTRLASSALH